MKSILRVGVYALAAISTLIAQDVSGTIGGTVLDPSAAAIPNAKVTITNTDRKLVMRTVTTGLDGGYAAPLLPVGTYSIKVEAPGFVAQQREAMRLNANDKLTINMTLAIGTEAEQVNVTEAPVAVNLGDATQQNTISGTQIRELPIATRNYEQLVMLTPGVSASQTDELYVGVSLPSGLASAIPYSINGMRNSANNWTIDGADNVDRGSNLTLLNYPSVDALDEFKVLRSVYTADTGRAGGAQINVVTKSGTNQFHGDAYEFFRNDALAANNTLNNMNGIRASSAAVERFRLHVRRPDLHSAPLQQRPQQDVFLLVAGVPARDHEQHLHLDRADGGGEARATSPRRYACRSRGARAIRRRRRSRISIRSQPRTSKTSSITFPRERPGRTRWSRPCGTSSTPRRN